MPGRERELSSTPVAIRGVPLAGCAAIGTLIFVVRVAVRTLPTPVFVNEWSPRLFLEAFPYPLSQNAPIPTSAGVLSLSGSVESVRLELGLTRGELAFCIRPTLVSSAEGNFPVHGAIHGWDL